MTEDNVTKTESRLTSLYLAFFLTVAGVMSFFFGGQESILTCYREQGEPVCTLSTSFLGKYIKKQVPVPGLRSAYVKDSCDEDGCNFRVMLVTETGEQALTQAFDSHEEDKQAKVDRIIEFISNPNEPTLFIHEDPGLWPYAGISLVIIGVLIALWTGYKTLRTLIRNDSI